MDIKLDFVPPTLVNFIARQLIGNGHKLYQKAVGSVATTDEDYRQALQKPMYVRIREGMKAAKKHSAALVGLDSEKTAPLLVEHMDYDPALLKTTPVNEIVEEEAEANLDLNGSSSNSTITTNEQSLTKGTFLSPEVEYALRTLDQAIAIVRRSGLSHSTESDCFSINGELPTSKSMVDGNAPKCSYNLTIETTHEMEDTPAKDFRNSGMGCVPTEVDYGQREMSPSKENLYNLHDKIPTDTAVTVKQALVLESMKKICDEESLRANGLHESSGHHENKFVSKLGKKKQRLCCFRLGLFQS